MENIVLKLHYRANFVEVLLVEDTDRILLIDVYNDMFDEVEAEQIEWPTNPSLAYSYRMRSVWLRHDTDLMEMFNRLEGKKIIDIWVGAEVKPCDVLVMSRQVRSYRNVNVDGVEVTCENKKQGTSREKLPCKRSVLKPVLKSFPKPIPEPDIAVFVESIQTIEDIELSIPLPKETVVISPRRSGRLNTRQVDQLTSPTSPTVGSVEPNEPASPIVTSMATVTRRTSPRFKPPQPVQASSSKVSKFKIPRTTAVRKGIYIPKDKASSVEIQESNTRLTRGSRSRVLRTPVTCDSDSENSDGSYKPSVEDEVDDEQGLSDLEKEDNVVISTLEFIDYDYIPYEELGWLDEDDGGYNAKLFKNGELYENKVFGAIRLKPWQIFMDKNHFKDVLRDYCIQEGFNLVVVKAESNRFTANCVTTNCGWRIHASVLNDGQTWAIKTIRNPEHGCDGVRNINPMANCKWVAQKLMEDIRANPAITAHSCNDLLLKRYGLNIPNSSLYKMKDIDLKEINGGHDESYRLLCQYCEMIKLTNPGSVALASGAVNQEGLLQFKSCFIAFHAQITGFIRGCRSLIGVDGAHLKGNYGGVLLSAVGIDGNNEIYPIAVAIVDSENKESWSYFFLQLKQILRDSGRDDWTIISDRQKGVEPALNSVWPEAYRRFCCRHLCKNFKQDHPGLLMYGLFWKVVNAISEFLFKKALESVVQHGGLGAARWFLDLGDKESWAKYMFDPRLCCEDNTSNFVESFNATLGVHRCNPALSLLEGIRRISMVRNASRAAAADTWPDDGICPNIINRLKVLMHKSRYCTAFSSGNGEFEVRDGGTYMPVNLNLRTCVCGAWQISGIPCKHAVRAILEAGREPADYVSEWFSVRKYREAYGLNIHPIADSSQWPTFDVLTLEPPPLKRAIGRPARNRRREPGEQRKGKRSIVITCRKCGCMRHNSKTCKGGHTAKEKRQLEGKVSHISTKTSRQPSTSRQTSSSRQPSSSRTNATSLNDLEALIMGTQASTSVNPTPNIQAQQPSSMINATSLNHLEALIMGDQATTSQGSRKRGRKRKNPSTSK